MAERLFGAIRPDGVRHAIYPVYTGGPTAKYGNALCDIGLHVAWCEPLKPGQRTCKRQPCKRYAEEALATQPHSKTEEGERRG